MVLLGCSNALWVVCASGDSYSAYQLVLPIITLRKGVMQLFADLLYFLGSPVCLSLHLFPHFLLLLAFSCALSFSPKVVTVKPLWCSFAPSHHLRTATVCPPLTCTPRYADKTALQ